MGRAPRFEETGLKKGPWTPEEDQILLNYIRQNGPGSWRAVPKLAGLRRCGKSCRLRWTNYLRPDIKRGPFTQEEERIIILLHVILGSRWSVIASQLPGRTDNEIKNFWNTHLKKRLLKMGFDPSTHAPRSEEAKPSALLRHKVQWENARLEAEARLSRETQVACSSTASYQTNSAVEENVNAPADYFFKVWNSHAGEAFRRESSSQSSKSSNSSCDIFDLNWVGDNQVSSTEIRNCKIPITSSPVSSFCPASTDHSFHHSLNPNDKAKENDSQRCNSGSANWIGDCGVITIEANSSTAAMSMDQTEHIKAPEGLCSSEKLGHSGGHCTDFSEIFLDFPHIENKCSSEKLGHSGGHCTDFSEIFLDFPHIENNNNRIGSMITELSSQEHSAWPWPELHLEDDEDDCGNVSGI